MYYKYIALGGRGATDKNEEVEEEAARQEKMGGGTKKKKTFEITEFFCHFFRQNSGH